ncbi:MAG: GspH/FimT family pseudopilin [Candidatus Thiodiazotropha sp. (ex Semelilucina semeliformis)]|nr:GspH/FimT family pseudopilin [Candidatus Thiodiazotropha sp. (ex Semelilucina semeliformis)]MCU7829204.1 GspH/FimT family pseudopilin [Candidatus Thiodiazotropha sp. (ex Myrtea sp. 'scaly one' KF741663)]
MTMPGWQNPRQQPSEVKGFTSIELLAALISSLLFCLVGLPAVDFLTYEGETHLLQQDSLASHLEFARSEAIRRELTVTVCPSRDHRNCLVRGDWQDGWIIFTDTEGLPLHVSVGDKMLHNQKRADESQPFLAQMHVIQYQSDGSIRLN